MAEQQRIIVYSELRHAGCAERQLVLQSRDIDSEIVIGEDGGFALAVDARDAATARTELETYRQENEQFDPRPRIRQPAYYDSLPGVLAYMLGIWGIAVAAEYNLFSTDWYGAGRIHSVRVLDGEWWRLATALTLHVDLSHIAANTGFGAILGYFAGRYFGYGLASLAILTSGILGNALNVWMKGPGHFAIGASTAVFGALGLIGIFAWRMRLYPQQSWPERLGPVIGAVALLAYTGTGGERTDIGAHFWGFIAGAGFGWFFARYLAVLRLDRQAQLVYSAMALTLLGAAWAAAIANTG